MRRICVIGVTGSGKSTLAAAVARRLGIRHVDLDELHWDPDWAPAPDDVFLERLRAALLEDGWVTAGNFSRTRSLTLDQADTIVWIDLPFLLNFWRLLRRTVHRLWTREELWNGNRERFWTQIASRDSIFLWFFQTYPRRAREYPGLLERYAQRGCQVVRLRSQREIDGWLASLPETRGLASVRQ